jgi:hypothetical protein
VGTGRGGAGVGAGMGDACVQHSHEVDVSPPQLLGHALFVQRQVQKCRQCWCMHDVSEEKRRISMHMEIVGAPLTPTRQWGKVAGSLADCQEPSKATSANLHMMVGPEGSSMHSLMLEHLYSLWGTHCIRGRQQR